MNTSYQHTDNPATPPTSSACYSSSPDADYGTVSVVEGMDDYQNKGIDRNHHRRRSLLLLIVGILLVVTLAYNNNGIKYDEAEGSLVQLNEQKQHLRGSTAAAVDGIGLLSASASATGKEDAPWEGGENAPKPDYNGEGKYDWQKCLDSKDPDCWSNEGQRVGGYWHNFGLQMHEFWKNFGLTIKNFFHPPPPPPTVAPAPTEPPKSVAEEEEKDAPIVETPPTAPAEEESVVETPPTVPAEKEPVVETPPTAPAEEESVVETPPTVPAEKEPVVETPPPPPAAAAVDETAAALVVAENDSK